MKDLKKLKLNSINFTLLQDLSEKECQLVSGGRNGCYRNINGKMVRIGDYSKCSENPHWPWPR